MAKRSLTPFLWFLFGGGGMVSAMLFPVHILLFGLAFPLGMLEAPGYEWLHALVVHPITRLYLFVFILLPLFHAAHRIRYTVYDLFHVQPSHAPADRRRLLRRGAGGDGRGRLYAAHDCAPNPRQASRVPRRLPGTRPMKMRILKYLSTRVGLPNA